ncbi:hypothetical protein [Ferrimonas lipolytica]|uniref:Uncharacterized protein n=1 Tax=Ferrimonas lipolytica TaxID=2724191 RepID=A0A6H1UC56_9GAMM|nr:hypothetical protein [Ferrimonas lipolytica]QIZ76677.1 hypothetical protein HER31_07210 [Ferrimonas lipolytica]
MNQFSFELENLRDDDHSLPLVMCKMEEIAIFLLVGGDTNDSKGWLYVD